MSVVVVIVYTSILELWWECGLGITVLVLGGE